MGKYWKCLGFVFALVFASCLLVFSFAPQRVSAEKEQETEIQPRGVEPEGQETEIQPRGEETVTSEQSVYHAAMGIQTATQIWIQRWGYFEKSQNEYYDTENYGKLYAAGGEFYDGTFEDVEIRGNGTYTVSLKDADFSGETAISQLHIATDIPLAESERLSFTDVTLEINGNEVLKFDEAVMEDEEPYLQGGAVILLLNHWRDSAIQAASSLGRSEDSSNGWEMLDGSGKNDVSISFTVSGLSYDNEEQAEAENVENDTEDEAELLPLTTEGKSIEDAKDAGMSSKSEENSLGTTQIAGIVIISLLVIIVVIIINIKKKGSY